jgi:hypothetical protein
MGQGVVSARGARLVSALLLITASASASGQAASSERYPWDKRPASCFELTGSTDPQCTLDSWPNWEETLLQVRFLYNKEQFILLERAMQDAASSDKRFTDGDTPASAAYWAFRRMMPGPGTHPGHRDKIARWKKAVPASDFVAFAQARFEYGTAWNVRGSGSAGSVSRESWELFSIRLQQAEQTLLDASEALKATPYWHNLLLAIALDSPRGRSDPEAVFAQAVKRWPRYFELYELRLTRLVPAWGGSWEQVESFIDRWTKELAGSEGTSLYARLYTSLKDQGVTPEQTAMDWPRMRRSFEDLTTRYPSARFKNLYASYACFARDRPAFSAAAAKLSRTEMDDEFWLSGHSYEACMRWGGI